MRLHDRTHAGQKLAEKLRELNLKNPIVLALPRGGVPVASVVSQALQAPLDIIAVRKIGAPFNPEYAIGAICENDRPSFNNRVLIQLGLGQEDAKQRVKIERDKIQNQIRKFRDDRPLPNLKGKEVVLVDDGLATGLTICAAIKHLKKKNVEKIIIAVPAAAKSSVNNLKEKVDDIVTIIEEERFSSVGEWYDDFTEVTDEEVISALKSAKQTLNSSNSVEISPKFSVTHMDSHSLESQILSEAIDIRSADDFDNLIQSLKDKRVVMLGESTHGTHEFYNLRSIISQRLIEEHGFNFIAVEGDWPDAYRLHKYINRQEGRSAHEVLMQTHRWPTWMWANEEVVKLAEWMKDHPAGFYGLDVYSLFDSIYEILDCVKKYDQKLAQELSQLYACFDPYEKNEVAYARSLLQYPRGCENEVTIALQRLMEQRMINLDSDEDLFSAQQNAKIIARAEMYYRAMILADEQSWNIRDRHMLETLSSLLQKHGEGAKAIVWAHNTHIGDYRATDMLENNYVNLGGLARETYGDESVALVGFGSYQGEVLAGASWGGLEQVMELPPAQKSSVEEIFHRVCIKRNIGQFYLELSEDLYIPLSRERLNQRAVGVVYNPRHEYRSNYVPSVLSKRYDHFIFVDQTQALKSLHATYMRENMPETWPSGQ